MSLRVIGSGLGRTSTHSLKLALERLLGAPCYHMLEVLQQPAHIPIWQRAIAGDTPKWEEFLTRYRATVDWPAAAFWKELREAYPEALVLLSVREVDDWWASADRTIFAVSRREPPLDPVFSAQLAMAKGLLETRLRRAGAMSRRRSKPICVTTMRSAAASRVTDCWNGVPGTAGRRSAHASVLRSPGNPFLAGLGATC